MLKKARVGAIVLYVKDLKRTLSFYGETLGIETEMISASGERFGRGAASNTELIFVERPEKTGTSPIIVFTVDGGIDDLVEQLANLGVQIVTPVREAGGGWAADFHDPDEHVCGFWQPGDAPRRLSSQE